MRRIICAATPKKWFAVGPFNFLLVHQAKVGFMHKGGCLQRMVYSLALQIAGS
jgi:hypothetical protein